MFVIADFQSNLNARLQRFERNHLRVRDKVRALIRSHARVGVNKLFGGHDAGGRHVQSGYALNVRLALANFRGIHESQAFDAVVFAAFLQREKLGLLVRIGGDDQLSAVAKRNAVLLAEFIRKAVAFDAQLRLQGVLRIIDSRMIDTAVAGAGGHSELGKLLDQKNVLPPLGNGARDGAADHAAADNQNIGLIHLFILLVAANFVEERLARNQARFRPVVHRVGSLFVGFVAVAPERNSAVHSVLVDGVEIKMEGAELFLVVLVVAGDARHRFKARIGGRFSLTHHFNDRVAAADLDVFLALSRGTRRADFVVHIAARADDWRIAYAPGYFPREPRSRGGCRNVSFGVHGHARNCAGGRVRDDAFS